MHGNTIAAIVSCGQNKFSEFFLVQVRRIDWWTGEPIVICLKGGIRLSLIWIFSVLSKLPWLRRVPISSQPTDLLSYWANSQRWTVNQRCPPFATFTTLHLFFHHLKNWRVLRRTPSGDLLTVQQWPTRHSRIRNFTAVAPSNPILDHIAGWCRLGLWWSYGMWETQIGWKWKDVAAWYVQTGASHVHPDSSYGFQFFLRFCGQCQWTGWDHVLVQTEELVTCRLTYPGYFIFPVLAGEAPEAGTFMPARPMNLLAGSYKAHTNFIFHM